MRPAARQPPKNHTLGLGGKRGDIKAAHLVFTYPLTALDGSQGPPESILILDKYPKKSP